MNLNTVIQRMPLWYRGKQSVHLESAPGRGKTTTFEAAPEIIGKRYGLNLACIVVNGGCLTVMDVLGFGVPKHHETHSEMVFTKPFFCRTGDGRYWDDFDGGILVIDEQDKLDPDVKKILGEARLSGRFGPHQLPNGWLVWSTGNSTKHRSGSTKQLDHEINRTMWLTVTDDIQSWSDWAVTHGVMPATRVFAEQNVHIVFQDGVPEKQGPWTTPRSLVQSDDYLQVLAGELGEVPLDAVTIEEIGGKLGAGSAAQYFNMLRLETKMPKYEKILKKPDEVSVPDKPDELMLIAYNLAHRVKSDEVEPVLKYVNRMPKEFGTTFATAACKRDVSLVAHKQFFAWAQQNASLMAAISR